MIKCPECAKITLRSSLHVEEELSGQKGGSMDGALSKLTPVRAS